MRSSSYFVVLGLVLLSGCADKYENQINEIRYATAITENKLYNADFQIWQRGTQAVMENGQSSYAADRWFSRNNLGPGSKVSYSRVEDFSQGSLYGARVEVLEPPHQSPTGSCELFQTLNNYDSLKFANDRASFSIRVKALGRVSKVGLQFVYNKTQNIATDPIGPEVLVDVNQNDYVLGVLANVPIGGELLPKGVLGVRIRVAAVSSGNLYDLENGFVVKQGMLNFGATPGPFRTRFEEFSQELAACQAYYEKSYLLEETPHATGEGQTWALLGPVISLGNRVSLVSGPVNFRYTKIRKDPTVTIYSPKTGLKGAWYNGTIKRDEPNVGITNVNHLAFTLLCDSPGGHEVYFQWTADAEIYP